MNNDLCKWLYVCTWLEHLLGHEQVIEIADVVPAREEHQDGSFLLDKDMTQHSAAEIRTICNRASQEEEKKKKSQTNMVPRLCPELPTSTFSFTFSCHCLPTPLWQHLLWTTGHPLLHINKGTDFILSKQLKKEKEKIKSYTNARWENITRIRGDGGLMNLKVF